MSTTNSNARPTADAGATANADTPLSVWDERRKVGAEVIWYGQDMDAAVSEVAEQLAIKTTRAGKVKSGKQRTFRWCGSTWAAEVYVDIENDYYLLELFPNPGQGWCVNVRCRKAEGLAAGQAGGLQFDVTVPDLYMGELYIPEQVFGPPLLFSPGEHLASGAVDAVIARIQAIRRGPEEEYTEDTEPTEEKLE